MSSERREKTTWLAEGASGECTVGTWVGVTVGRGGNVADASEELLHARGLGLGERVHDLELLEERDEARALEEVRAPAVRFGVREEVTYLVLDAACPISTG